MKKLLFILFIVSISACKKDQNSEPLKVSEHTYTKIYAFLWWGTGAEHWDKYKDRTWKVSVWADSLTLTENGFNSSGNPYAKVYRATKANEQQASINTVNDLALAGSIYFTEDSVDIKVQVTSNGTSLTHYYGKQ